MPSTLGIHVGRPAGVEPSGDLGQAARCDEGEVVWVRCRKREVEGVGAGTK